MPKLADWRTIALCGYGTLSLTSMAGMGIGGGAFFLASLLALFSAWKRGQSPGGLLPMRAPAIASAFLFTCAVASLAFAVFFPPLGEVDVSFLALKKFHFFFLPFLIALAFYDSKQSIERNPFWFWWSGMGIACGIIASLQFWGGFIFPDAWLSHRFFRPIIGTFGTLRYHGQGLMFFHLSFASCMSFVAAAGVARLFWPLANESRRERLYWAAVALAGLLAVFYSFSRIAFVGLIAVCFSLAFLKRPKFGSYALLVFAVLGAFLWMKNDTFRSRFEYAKVTKSERENMWTVSWFMFEERPLTGVGFSQTGGQSPAYAEKLLGYRPLFTSHAHNNILDIMASMGLFGLVAYFGWWFLFFAMAWKVFRASPPEERWLPAAAFAGFISFHVNGLTQVNFWDGKSQHTLMIWAGVTLALWLRLNRRDVAKSGLSREKQ